jgi:hypothetical protein
MTAVRKLDIAELVLKLVKLSQVLVKIVFEVEVQIVIKFFVHKIWVSPYLKLHSSGLKFNQDFRAASVHRLPE